MTRDLTVQLTRRDKKLANCLRKSAVENSVLNSESRFSVNVWLNQKETEIIVLIPACHNFYQKNVTNLAYVIPYA